MAYDEEAFAKRFEFQSNQQKERLDRADAARDTAWERQEKRDKRKGEEQRERDENRNARNDKIRQENIERQEAKDATRRHDKVAQQGANAELSLQSQKEVTYREQLLQKLGAHLYRQKLDDDFDHDVRTRDIGLQEYEKKGEIDTRNLIARDNNTASNTKSEIREHLRSLLTEKLATHVLNEHAKQTATKQTIQVGDAQSANRIAEINAKSGARIREKEAENQLKMDFEFFMHDLRQSTAAKSTEEIVDILDQIEEVS